MFNITILQLLELNKGSTKVFRLRNIVSILSEKGNPFADDPDNDGGKLLLISSLSLSLSMCMCYILINDRLALSADVKHCIHILSPMLSFYLFFLEQ